MLRFLKNYDKYEYAAAGRGQLIAGLAVDFLLGLVGAVCALLAAAALYHLFLRLT